jgi:hypothetical protein
MEAADAQRVLRAAIQEQNFSMHLLGTCRMGNDARTSVVDRYHRTRTHDVRNLFVCGRFAARPERNAAALTVDSQIALSSPRDGRERSVSHPALTSQRQVTKLPSAAD